MVAPPTKLPTLPPWVHVSPVITERNVSRWRLSVKISPHKILVCHFSHHTVKLLPCQLIYDYSTVHTVSILAGPYPHGTVSTPLLNTFALISARVLETLRSRDTSEVGLGSLCGYSAKKERSMEIMPITVLLALALLWPGTPAMTTG